MEILSNVCYILIINWGGVRETHLALGLRPTALPLESMCSQRPTDGVTVGSVPTFPELLTCVFKSENTNVRILCS